MTAPTPIARPGTERPPLRPAALVLLACAFVTAALAGWAVAVAPASARTPLAWGAGAAAVALSAAVTVAFHALRALALSRRQLAAAQQETARLQQEQARRAAEFGQEHARLTAAHARELAELTAEQTRVREELVSEHARVREELTAENARVQAELTAENTRIRTELTAEHTRVRTELTARVRTAESERAAALAACANAAGRMQALATGMLADLREMEGRHADEDVLTDLLHLDHRTAQAGRIADSVAVLTGARSGRRWARPIVMESILRGAMGRIGGYQRVRVHSASEVAVAGHAAEGVMHALAELLDNAANFSPPTSEVHVYIEEVASGVIVSVEDSGLVMGPVQQRRAERAVSGETTGLGGLSGTRLGLAVVGRLARKHGLTVSFRPSARGGTGVLLLIPQELLSRPSDPTPPPATPLPRTPARAQLPAASQEPVAPQPSASAQDPTSAQHLTAAQPLAPSPHQPSLPPADAPSPTAPAAAPHTPDTLPDPLTDRVDRDPVPTHHSPADRPAAAGAGAEGVTMPLPKRRRGRTLAAAERARADSDTGENPRPRPADAADTAARFSSFRQAVRATPPDPSSDPSTPQHPEGDSPR
ncbi:ATP-binding protein [Streptomyces sp. WAC 01529]|uniref:ATP-binding protein n=1 Tax=Streptomyces sp. WAC 01529 TaxID=2203205 RepID=UPI000F6C7E64|nr:ATP-binding protein [Streptomyces sp. WAC 01529]AZM53906.1 ATP-binding protein [Streptomyces sp. WAC 01529]